MKVLFGLGNPGKKYLNNRHNIGHMILDNMATEQRVSFKKNILLKANSAHKNIRGQEALLVKTRTFMNNSGLCVNKVVKKYNVDLSDILIVYDDSDLEFGAIRFREKGSSGGHRGMASIINQLGTEGINRLRIGIGTPVEVELADYVLSDFNKSEKKELNYIIEQAVSACFDWVNNESNFLKQKYNRRGGK